MPSIVSFSRRDSDKERMEFLDAEIPKIVCGSRVRICVDGPKGAEIYDTVVTKIARYADGGKPRRFWATVRHYTIIHCDYFEDGQEITFKPNQIVNVFNDCKPISDPDSAQTKIRDNFVQQLRTRTDYEYARRRH